MKSSAGKSLCCGAHFRKWIDHIYGLVVIIWSHVLSWRLRCSNILFKVSVTNTSRTCILVFRSTHGATKNCYTSRLLWLQPRWLLPSSPHAVLLVELQSIPDSQISYQSSTHHSSPISALLSRLRTRTVPSSLAQAGSTRQGFPTAWLPLVPACWCNWNSIILRGPVGPALYGGAFTWLKGFADCGRGE